MGLDFRSARQQLNTFINQLGARITHICMYEELESVDKSAEDDDLFFDLIHETK